MVDRFEMTLHEEVLPLEANGLISSRPRTLAANQAESNAALVLRCICHLVSKAGRLIGRIVKTRGFSNLDLHFSKYHPCGLFVE